MPSAAPSTLVPPIFFSCVRIEEFRPLIWGFGASHRADKLEEQRVFRSRHVHLLLKCLVHICSSHSFWFSCNYSSFSSRPPPPPPPSAPSAPATSHHNNNNSSSSSSSSSSISTIVAIWACHPHHNHHHRDDRTPSMQAHSSKSAGNPLHPKAAHKGHLAERLARFAFQKVLVGLFPAPPSRVNGETAA